MEAKVHNQEGREIETIALPDSIFNLPWNKDLVHQVMVSMLANRRRGTAHTKGRSEVSGGGRKPWRQKGTGRARHGSIRSPLWRGGGITHGPQKEKNYGRKINKRAKTRSLCVVLSKKLRDAEILFVDDIKIREAKTKAAQKVLNSLSAVPGFERLAGSKKKIAFLALDRPNQILRRSFNNLPQIKLGRVTDLNPLDVLNHKYLIVSNPKESLKLISSRLSDKR